MYIYIYIYTYIYIYISTCPVQKSCLGFCQICRRSPAKRICRISDFVKYCRGRLVRFLAKRIRRILDFGKYRLGRLLRFLAPKTAHKGERIPGARLELYVYIYII